MRINNPSLQEKKFHGKNVIVVGGGGGIGKKIVERILRLGGLVIATSRVSNPPELESLSAEFPESLTLIEMELEDEESVRSGVSAISQTRREFDGLVLAAGVPHGNLLSLTKASELRRVFEVNFFSQLILLQNLTRRMKSGASCVVIGSSSSEHIQRGNAVYGASKVALQRITLGLATELASRGVRVNVVSPGLVNTAMLKEMDPVVLQSLKDRTLRGAPLEPDEVASVILFLLDDYSLGISGEVLHLDAGFRN